MSENIIYHASSAQQLAYGDISEALACIEAQVAPLFRRRDWQRRAAQYLRALLTSPASRRNAQNLAGVVDGATPRAFQRFLSEAPWDQGPIINALPALLAPLLQSDQSMWVLEEIAFAKQGEHSVGVAWQASGVHGAFQNCQVGVFLAYAAPLASAFASVVRCGQCGCSGGHTSISQSANQPRLPHDRGAKAFFRKESVHLPMRARNNEHWRSRHHQNHAFLTIHPHSRHC